MLRAYGLIGCLLFSMTAMARAAEEPIAVLIVDGQNNHDWRATTPYLKRWLDEAGLFQVDIATSPPSGEDMSAFRPRFGDYDVVVSNYNGDLWHETTQDDFVRYVRGGGGFVVIHAANNSFGEWDEYNEIIGLGGWGGRNEASGPYVYYRDGQFVRDPAPGPGGSHGQQHEFQVVIRDDDHPVTRGMPASWLHAKDELYDRLRGPATNMQVLATAFSDSELGGRGMHEPMIMTIEYGKGRVFHTPMGHADYSMQGVGFIATYQRGTEWAARGEVTQPLPDDFPTRDRATTRD